MGDGSLGEICLFAGWFEPLYWDDCDGRLLTIAANPALYAILGNRFGGHSGQDFALPNLVAPAGMRFIICISGETPARPDSI